jgi:glutamyl-tRNA synthetase
VQQEDAVVGAAFAKALQEKNIAYPSQDYVNIVCGLVKERAVFVEDLFELALFFYEAPSEFDEKAAKKAWKEDTSSIMKQVADLIITEKPKTAAAMSDLVKGWIKEQEMGFGKVMMPLRLSLVGSLMGPDVFEIAALIGAEETAHRINTAVDKLSN